MDVTVVTFEAACAIYSPPGLREPHGRCHGLRGRVPCNLKGVEGIDEGRAQESKPMLFSNAREAPLGGAYKGFSTPTEPPHAPQPGHAPPVPGASDTPQYEQQGGAGDYASDEV